MSGHDALPPSAALRSQPEAPVRPDLSERCAVRLAMLRRRHPGAVRRLRAWYAVLTWATLGTVAVGLFLSPSLWTGVVVAAGLVVAVTYLVLLCRSRTVAFASVAALVVVGALAAVPVAAAEYLVARVLGLPADDPVAVVYLAAPIEEVGKLMPLVVLAAVARHRVRRLAVVDFALVAAAVGAGFQLAEDGARRLAAEPGAPVGPLQVAAGVQYAWTHLFPGGVDWGPARFGGHAVLSALVGVGIGLAARWYPRRGPAVWFLPAGCLVWAILDHMGWAGVVHEPVAGQVLAWPVRVLYTLSGAGHATGWVLVALVAVAIVADFRAMAAVEPVLPALPGRAPRALVVTSENLVDQMLRSVPEGAAPVVRRLASGAGAAVTACADAAARVWHEMVVLAAAARHGPPAAFAAARLVRQRRELAQAVYRTAGRARRDIPPRAEVQARAARLARQLALAAVVPAVVPAAVVSGAVVSGAVVAYRWAAAAVAGPGGGAGAPDAPQPAPAFVAAVADDLAVWWHALPPIGRPVAVACAVALLTLVGGIWRLPVESAHPAAHEPLGNPGGTVRRLVARLTPGQVVYYGIVLLAALAIPRAVSRPVSRPVPRSAPAHGDAAASRPSARLSFPLSEIRRRYGVCHEQFDLPDDYTARNGRLLRDELRRVVDSADAIAIPNARFRGEPAEIWYEPRQRIAVIFRAGGVFRSCWRLTPLEHYELVSRGSL